MPRSPLITGATRDLALYFGALTDPDFIDNTWSARIVAKNNRSTTAVNTATATQAQILDKLNAYADITRALDAPPTGKSQADSISDLINGAVTIGDFAEVSVDSKYKNEFRIYGIPQASGLFVNTTFFDISGIDAAYNINTSIAEPDRLKPNAYIVNVSNPAMGPATRDVGPLEIFMNSVPTLELSKCVPYVNVELITSRPGRDSGGNFTAPTLLRFLNPNVQNVIDVGILDAQKTQVASEATDFGTGTRSGMELFTVPQTLVNLGPTGEEYVPIIDRMRPLASLGDLQISVKMQKNTTMFTQIRMEVIVHDRSRLREIADLVRPDLYARTFLDITYGWSHPEGGLDSQNRYGKFLDAMKIEGRYRIASSSYSFEEGGAVKISLNLFSLGSIDLLSLTSRAVKAQMIELEKIVQAIRKAVEAKRASGLSAPAMARFDFLNSITDPNSLLRAASDSSFMKALDKIQGDGDELNLSDDLVKVLVDAYGEVTLKKIKGKSTWVPEENSVANVAGGTYAGVSKLAENIKQSYGEIISSIPVMGNDHISDDFFSKSHVKRLNAMIDDMAASPDDVKSKFAGCVSLGSAMAALILYPLADSGLYEEVQLIFYPFNDYAGGVHGCPISWFPIDKARLKTYVQELSTKSPEISLNAMIELINSRFVNFAPDRAYLMADYYNTAKAENEAKVEYKNGKTKIKDAEGNTISVTYEAAYAKTLEDRLTNVGIPEKKFTQPTLGIFTEGCPLLHADGSKVIDKNGRSKTLLKIHIFDAASTAYRTLGELLAATRDEQLGVILGAVSDANRDTSNNPTGEMILQRRQDLDPILKAGLSAGILREIKVSGVKGTEGDPLPPQLPMYSVEGSYESIKRLIAAGMPTITYGSSTSAITQASFSTANSAAMSNAMMARSFQAPGEAAPSQVDGGVPMQLVPASLSISTFGCPLFAPMQRLFVDFGTGTSIDNVYYVLGAEHKIGKAGFTTDVKMGYGEGFTTFTSLSQNLALLAIRVNDALVTESSIAAPAGVNPLKAAGPTFPSANLNLGSDRDRLRAIREARKKIDELFEDAGRAIGRSLAPAARVAIEIQMRIDAELQKVKDRIALEIEEAKEAAIKKLEALVPEKVKIAVAEAQKKAAEIAAKAAVVAQDVQTAIYIAQLVLNADQLIAEIGAEGAAILLTAAKEELAAQLAANPPKPPAED